MLFDICVAALPAQILYGLWMRSSDKTVSKDIQALSRKYYGMINKEPQSVLPFYVLSKNYDKDSGMSDLFIGGQEQFENLEMFEIPAGLYGKTTVKPKFGFLWGLAIGQAKRFFYTKWISHSGYGAVNMEYEYHTEKSIGKKPEIELHFALEEKPRAQE